MQTAISLRTNISSTYIQHKFVVSIDLVQPLYALDKRQSSYLKAWYYFWQVPLMEWYFSFS